MKALLAAVEMTPFARSGAAADLVHALSTGLPKTGIECSIALPFHRQIRENTNLPVQSTGVSFSVRVGPASYPCEVLETRTRQGVQVFFLRRDEFFDRSGIFGSEGKKYEDNAARFLFFSKAVLELARRLDPSPDLIHAHDWPCSMIPILSRYAGFPFHHALSIHDLSEQGRFWSYDFALTNLPERAFRPEEAEFFGGLNFLKCGIVTADRVIFPGAVLAREAQLPGQGAGLEQVLQSRAANIEGIPYGLDPAEWNPGKDPSLKASFTSGRRKGKLACREDLLASNNLAPDPSGAVAVFLSRLTRAQGLDLLLDATDRFLEGDHRLIIAGRGDGEFDTELWTMQRRHKGKFRFLNQPSEPDLRKCLGGADLLVAPAKLDSGGLRIIQAQRYGTIPVVRGTPGLCQLIEDAGSDPATGTGFVFYEPSSDALMDSLRRALQIHSDTKKWSSLVRRSMEKDESWEKCCQLYANVYDSIVLSPCK
jgi:starch synthase